MDVRVISLREDFDLSSLRALFPRSDVAVQPAVDLRDVDARDMYRADLIGESTLTTLTSGRKWHWEFSGKGGVGLAHANRLALESGRNALLLLEEDFRVGDDDRFRREVALLRAHADEFDLAVFGVKFLGDRRQLRPVAFMPPGWYQLVRDKFWYTHCALYTPRGRETIAKLLRERRLEMQIDSLYATWAEMRLVTVLVQVDDATVTQRAAATSTVQEDVCVLCDLTPSLRRAHLAAPVWLALAMVLAYGAVQCTRSKEKIG